MLFVEQSESKYSDPVNMSQGEMHLKLAERARVNPDMSIENIDSIATRAVKVLRKIQDVPRYS